MAASPTDRFERVRESLLHLGLRQITEEPGLDQPADFARRKARFKQNRRDLDKFRAKQSAARVAAEVRVDSELRAKLEAHNGCGINRLSRTVVATFHTVNNATRPVIQMQGTLSDDVVTAGRRSSARVASRARVAASSRGLSPRRMSRSDTIENRGKSDVVDVNWHHRSLTTESGDGHSIAASPSSFVAPTGIQCVTTSVYYHMPRAFSKLIVSQGPAFAPVHNSSAKSKLGKFVYEPAHDSSATINSNPESNLVDRTRSSQINNINEFTSVIPSRLSSCTVGHSVRSHDGDVAPNGALEAAANTSRATSPLSGNIDVPNSWSALDPNDDTSGPSNEHRKADDSLPSTAASASRSDCTSRHFRIRKITGRDSVDGDTYYVVSWKSSWVPSDMIKTGEDGQERYIKIDGRDWRIAGTIKTKVKKGISKDLVRWVDDTLEPVKRLRRALAAIIEFELAPRLKRRVVSFNESLIDRAKILHQSEDDFREAQVHLARKWPMIEPRNDIDLLPALRQIFQEQSPRRGDDMRNRKTYQRLINQPQLRRLCWGEEYLLAGRYYECTPPKRNALLLQVVAEGTGDGCCERCVTDAAPFKECVRDTSDDNPWLNGACANCGTAEANSTCCHHLVGTSHLERGRLKGLTSERLREFINPTRSIELLDRLEFENDDNSDTYSADSYAESDTSSAWEPERSNDDSHTIYDNDGDGQPGENSINHLWTPEAPLEDEPDSHRQYSAVSSSGESGGLFVSPVTQSINPFDVHRSSRIQERPTTQGISAFTMPDVTRARGLDAVATGCGNNLLADVARGSERPSYFDRSSATMAAASPASKLACRNATRDITNDDRDHYAQLPDNDDTYDKVDSPFVQDSPIQVLLERDVASPESVITSASRAAAIQSVEIFGRTLTHVSAINKALSDESQLSPLKPKGRKRAASQPSEDEPAAFRSSTSSSLSCQRVFSRSESNAKKPAAMGPSANAVADSSSTGTKLDRGSTHDGCRANWPCLHPDHATPDDGTFVPVYRNTIDASHQFSIGEVQYILSRCTCHWASAFTKVWDGWWDFEGTPVDVELTKPQFLLSYWAEYLLEAARECCPTDPRNREFIIID